MYRNAFVCIRKILLCNVTFPEEKKHRPTSQTFPFDIIRAMYFCRAASPNSMRVCPRREMLSLPSIPITLFRPMLESPLIRRFPAGGDTSASRAFVGGKMPYLGDGVCRDGSQ